MVDGAKFKSHDSDSHLGCRLIKIAAERKRSNIFVTELKLQVRLACSHCMLKKKKKKKKNPNWGKRLKLSNASLITIRKS